MQLKNCNQLPGLVYKSSFNDDMKKFVDYIYQIYKNDFFYNKVYYRGLLIKTYTDLTFDTKQESFNHLVTREGKHRIRFYDEKRCERIRWVKVFIETIKCTENCNFKVWTRREKNKNVVKIWCDKCNYIIILENRGDHYQLVTGYNTDIESFRIRFEQEYKEYTKQKNL